LVTRPGRRRTRDRRSAPRRSRRSRSSTKTPAIEDRAVEVQLALAGKGKHRAPSIPDLVIAASAELAGLTGLTVLHVDKDFDLIANITGQSLERLQT
jgi:predicted nucleic acid-binding protein